jgi:hypothetical protein
VVVVVVVVVEIGVTRMITAGDMIVLLREIDTIGQMGVTTSMTMGHHRGGEKTGGIVGEFLLGVPKITMDTCTIHIILLLLPDTLNHHPPLTKRGI